ncbi:MAG: M23 family metallopeptidase [Oligoflexales bacterium]|nr:M23 family metallopeptidase [Oligoflexales bacterium]
MKKSKNFTLMVIPDQNRAIKQVRIHRSIFKLGLVLFVAFSVISTYIVFDYAELQSMRRDYRRLLSENSGLKSEARALVNSLEEVKTSLKKVNDYSSKLDQITKLRVDTVSKKTGIGPLNHSEYIAAKLQDIPNPKSAKSVFPTGVKVDSLAFRPIFERLSSLQTEADQQAFQLQRLLSSLNQQKSFINSVPSVAPVSGWVASGFGWRISPFTGARTLHNGLDLAASPGTPVLSPADGVVLFSGAKEGYGNFIMIAHGYGIVSRYGHNAQNMVQAGQKILRGEQIATVGSTGRTTGPHLHYEVWHNSSAVDPKKFMLDSF